METRYIPRFRLPDRLYTEGSPVVLAAGALLEDTQMPRLVVQLKFKSISAKPISALEVEVRDDSAVCGDSGPIKFRYTGLAVQRGQAFGQYAAIVLPPESTRAFTAQVCSVVFADGTVWNPPAGAPLDSAACLPPFGGRTQRPGVAGAQRGQPAWRALRLYSPGGVVVLHLRRSQWGR